MPTSPFPDNERHVIPRWRSVHDTAALHELDSVEAGGQGGDAGTSEALATELDRKIARWEEVRSLGHQREATSLAAEIVGFAVVAGHPEWARLAASTLATSDSVRAPTRKLAQRVLTPSDEANTERTLWQLEPEVGDKAIGRLKTYVRNFPRDPLAWVELARQYTTAGHASHALRAMKVGLSLAPGNRYVLRSAARLYIYLGDVDRAAAILRKAPGLLHDPWLLAAEIAVTAQAGSSSALLRRARQMLKSERFRPAHTSELASELATAELAAGKDRAARKTFAAALVEPHENGVAQAEWASTQMALNVSAEQLHVPRLFEARAREAYEEERWAAAFEQAELWLKDQPFAIGPAALGSFVAATALSDHVGAERVARLGLRANPHSAVLINNLAFVLLNQGKIEEPAVLLHDRAADGSTSREVAMLTATRGLLAYRQGNSARGRSLYEEAMKMARSLSDDALHATALFVHGP